MATILDWFFMQHLAIYGFFMGFGKIYKY